MQRYILRRLFQSVVALIGVSIIVFMLARFTGDPTALLVPYDATQEDVDALRAMLGLDKPLYVQYWKFISMVAQGDFGVSLKWNRPCLSLFMERFPATLLLASAAMVWSLIIGILIGILSAVKVGGWFDNFGRIFALLGQGLPHFWLGLMLILLFAVNLRWFPSSGIGSFRHLIMPSFTLGWFLAASLTRLTRSTMLDVLDTNYITMARVKGVPEKSVITKHAFKNAMIPVLTMAAMNFVVMLNGTVMTETVFNWPGVGRLIVDAILARDYMVVQACVLIASILFVLVNLMTDILYAYIDPRIRYE